MLQAPKLFKFHATLQLLAAPAHPNNEEKDLRDASHHLKAVAAMISVTAVLIPAVACLQSHHARDVVAVSLACQKSARIRLQSLNRFHEMTVPPPVQRTPQARLHPHADSHVTYESATLHDSLARCRKP